MRSFGNGLAIVALCAGLAACGGKGGVPAIGANDHALGNPKSPVEVVEYASAACSHCAAFDRDVFPAFKAKYIDTGQIHYALRELVRGPPAYAVGGFLLADCAGKDKYFPMLEAVYRAQQVWEDQNAKGERMDFRTPLLQVAESAGMSEADFTKCVGDEKALDAFNKRTEKNEVDSARAGTPAFFVNGKKLPDGEPTLATLDKAIADAKAGKK